MDAVKAAFDISRVSNRSPWRYERFMASLQNIEVQGPANGNAAFKLIYTCGVKFKVFWKSSRIVREPTCAWHRINPAQFGIVSNPLEKP
jgi:hypothetical protein